MNYKELPVTTTKIPPTLQAETADQTKGFVNEDITKLRYRALLCLDKRIRIG